MNTNLLLGVSHIDHQHSELHRSFQHLLSIEPSKEAIAEALSRLTIQLHDHLKAEETFMKDLDMPASELLEHEQAHSHIIECLTEIHLESMHELRIPFEEIINRVSAYVNQHVIEFDLRLKGYLPQSN